jgi:release factor glutamine methyltransferase
VAWHAGDLFAALPTHLKGRVDLFVANPPYVALHEFDALPVDVKYEPTVALVGGETGMEILERICGDLPAWLAPEGCFALEVGETQGSAVVAMCSEFRAEVRRDLSGRDRFVVGRR